MTPRAGRAWWVGVVLAVAAGACLTAPRAAADCAYHPFTLGSLPFADGFHRPDAVKHSESKPTPAPCNGPHCRKVPSDPTPPAPVSPPSSGGEDWAWVDSAPATAGGARPSWTRGDRLLAPLFDAAPLERPPR